MNKILLSGKSRKEVWEDLDKETRGKKEKKTQRHGNQCCFMKIVCILMWLEHRSHGEKW